MTLLPQKLAAPIHRIDATHDDAVVRWAEMQVILLARSAMS